MSKGSEKLLWAIIEEMDWAKYSQQRRGYEAMKVNFMRNYGVDMAKKVRDFAHTKQSKLMKKLNTLLKVGKRYGDYGGDDSFGDMTAHVVGLGEDYYNAVMKDPSLLDDLTTVECFMYALPYGEDDYRKMDTEYHIEFAIESMAQVVENVKEAVERNTAEDHEYIDAADVLRRLALVVAGDYTHAVEDLNHNRDYNKICNISTGAANCLFDYKRYGKQTYLG